MCDKVGEQHAVPQLIARAALGKGVTARRRGNYPRARKYFEAGLERAEAASLTELAGQAHQGLVIAAATARDYDTALVHGWRAYELLSGDTTRQAEMLVNLARICVEAGYPAAGLRGYFAATSRHRSPRFCLPTYGSAAEAGAALGHLELVERLSSRIDEMVTESGLPYESAQALRSLYTAYSRCGDAPRAEGYRTRARELAKRNGFFEVVLATEPPEVSVAPKRQTRRRALAQPSFQVVQSIEALDAPDHEELLELTHAGQSSPEIRSWARSE
jgi:tetratricopeptide (TPR) repeat protein